MKCLFVEQNKQDGNSASRVKPVMMEFGSWQDVLDFIGKNFSGPPVHHRMGEHENVMGFQNYVQEYDPKHYNDTANELFFQANLDYFPGKDDGGILGNVLFY